MSDKRTAYQGESFHALNDEHSQNQPMIDPHTGQPIQHQPVQHQPVQQWQEQPVGNLPQDTYTQQGYTQDMGQGTLTQTQYNPQDYVDQSANQGYEDYHQQQNQYQTAYPQQTEMPAGYGYEQPAEVVQQTGYNQTYSQQDYNAAGYGQQGNYNSAGYEQETDPYLAAHQNATPPFDAAQHGIAAHTDYQQAQDPYQDQQAYFGQAQVDTGQAPALYNTGHDGLAHQHDASQQGYAMPQEGYEQTNYQHQDYQGYEQAGMDYGHNPYAGQAVQQPLPQGMTQLNDPFAPVPLQQAQSEDLAASGKKSFLVGAMILGSVIIGGGVAFAYKYSGDNGNEGKAPIILSDGGAKVAPDDPGGTDFQNKKKKIFERLSDGGLSKEAAVATTGDPEVVNSLRGEIKDPNNGQREEIASVKQDDSPGGPRIVKTIQFNRNGEPIVDTGAINSRVQEVKDIAGVAIDTGKPSRTVKTVRAGAAVQERKVVEQNVASLEQKAQNAVGGDGDFVVQISARRSQQDALAAFSSLKSKYGDVLSGYRPLIQRADLGNKGIFYRLRVGPMQTKDSATSVCSKLKSKGLPSCFVTDR